MHMELETELLKLTRTRSRITVTELVEHLHTQPDRIGGKIEDLARERLVSRDREVLEMNTVQRMNMAAGLIHRGYDPQRISRLLDWREFEKFAAESLEQNGFRTLHHLVFKSRVGRREIDLIAWNDSFLFAIDCKHWSRGLGPSSSRQVARDQLERVESLAERAELLRKHGVTKLEKRYIIPVILCLADSRHGVVDGIPVVAISRLISFLYGVSPIDEGLRRIPVRMSEGQLPLF
jgi:Holliday junction resolvase-like predicted endonuclease